MVLFAFRKFSVTKLFIAAAVCLLMTDTFATVELYRKKVIIHNGENVVRSGTYLTNLTPIQKENLDEYNRFVVKNSLVAKQEAAIEAIKKTKGEFAGLYKLHSQKAISMQTSDFFIFFFWDILLFMFIGLAFYRLGIITGNASSKFYWILTVSGLGIGLLLSWLRLQPLIENSFDEFSIVRKTGIQFYEIARCFRSLGVFGLIMLLYKSNRFSWLFKLLQPVGQMALTNYLMQSVLCGLFFYGIGFGMFGRFERVELYYVVAVIWLLQVIFSHIWLKYFLYGPFEWTWRSLTYWEKQPLRKEKKSGYLTE
jgi:uncharacterized protein